MNFENLLDGYMHERINENMLYDYMKQHFEELFNEYRFRELKYLKIYPFISELQDEDLYRESILKEKIKKINNILNGWESFSYDLWMKLEKREINQIYKIWGEYKEKRFIPFDEVELLQRELSKVMLNTKTIEDLCWEKLLTLLIGLPTVDDDFCTYNYLYTQEIDKTSICEDVEKIMEILEGKRPLHILLKYANSDCMYTIF